MQLHKARKTFTRLSHTKLMKGDTDTKMAKPKMRSRYIRRMHEREERARLTRDRELRDLAAFLREASREEVRASLVLGSSKDTPL
jgi:hypothetical protein